jgi:sugar lactone lactonase YvrE
VTHAISPAGRAESFPHADLDIERSPATALYIAKLDAAGNLAGRPKEIEVQGSRHVTALAFRRGVPGSYLCTTHTGLAYLDEATGALTPLPNRLGEIVADADKDKFRFNDGVCDSRGRWYFHSMSRDQAKPEATLYMYEHGMHGKADLKVLETGFAIGNGPVIDEERGKLYFNFTEQALGCAYLPHSVSGWG